MSTDEKFVDLVTTMFSIDQDPERHKKWGQLVDGIVEVATTPRGSSKPMSIASDSGDMLGYCISELLSAW